MHICKIIYAYFVPHLPLRAPLAKHPSLKLAMNNNEEDDDLFVAQDDETLIVNGDGSEQVVQCADVADAPLLDPSPLLGRTVPAQRSAFVQEAAKVQLNAHLKYQRDIIQELLEQDALLVLGKGLGMSTIVANVLHAMDVAGTKRDPSNKERQTGRESLVLLVGADSEENSAITEELFSLGNNENSPHRGMEIVTTDAISVSKRAQLYERGGIFSITSRILVVDLLSKNMDPASVTGIVILHADRVSSTSTEAFILKVYRDNNKFGFIKALTDRPEAICFGFSPLQERMKTLQLRKVLLWPRFRYEVKRELEHNKRNKEVIEIKVEMTQMMMEMQSALREAIQACISQIKSSVSKVVDTEDWTLDESIERPDFTRLLRAQLDPYWHRLPARARQVMSNLEKLCEFLDALTSLDSVSFYQMLEQYYDESLPEMNSFREPPPWLSLDAANTLFHVAKSRVYGKEVEELPKWEHLAQVLDEIASEKAAAGGAGDGTGPIVIACKTRGTAVQIRRYLSQLTRDRDASGSVTFSGQKYMRSTLRQYKTWKHFLLERKIARKERAKDDVGFRVVSGEPPIQVPVTESVPENERKSRDICFFVNVGC
jgi:DNA excision repair protein ERCC-4